MFLGKVIEVAILTDTTTIGETDQILLRSWCLEDNDYIETMYRLVRSSWGKGYATEAAKLYLKYGFEELKTEEIIGIIVVQNDPSRKVLKKLGMTWRRNTTFSGHTVEIYSIKRTDWKGTGF